METTYSVRDAAEEIGIPHGTMKNRVAALKKHADHPERKYLHPSHDEYKQMRSDGKQVEEWTVDSELVQKMKQKEERRRKKNGGVESKKESTRHSAGDTVERELIETLRSSLKWERDRNEKREAMYVTELQILGEAMDYVKSSGREYFAQMEEEVARLKLSLAEGNKSGADDSSPPKTTVLDRDESHNHDQSSAEDDAPLKVEVLNQDGSQIQSHSESEEGSVEPVQDNNASDKKPQIPSTRNNGKEKGIVTNRTVRKKTAKATEKKKPAKPSLLHRLFG